MIQACDICSLVESMYSVSWIDTTAGDDKCDVEDNTPCGDGDPDLCDDLGCCFNSGTCVHSYGKNLLVLYLSINSLLFFFCMYYIMYCMYYYLTSLNFAGYYWNNWHTSSCSRAGGSRRCGVQCPISWQRAVWRTLPRWLFGCRMLLVHERVQWRAMVLQ